MYQRDTFTSIIMCLYDPCTLSTDSSSLAVVQRDPAFPLSFATALFSFLYHLATYEASGDALVSSGIMETLLQVLEWRAFEPMNITVSWHWWQAIYI